MKKPRHTHILAGKKYLFKTALLITAAMMTHGAYAATTTGSANEDTSSARRVVLFEQPPLKDIKNKLYVPLASQQQALLHRNDKSFKFVSWQVNPNPGTGGLMVPVGCRTANVYTGLAVPPNEPTAYQQGYRNACGASLAQSYGNVVGSYINSRDLTQGSNFNKMMITPTVQITPTQVFSNPEYTLLTRFRLQVPTVESLGTDQSRAYITPYLRFKDVVSGTTLSYGIGVFHHKAGLNGPVVEVVPRKDEHGEIMIIAPLVEGSTRVTAEPESTYRQNAPWTGWKNFAFTINYNQFAKALQDAKAAYPDSKMSMRPEDYQVFQFHLNAELKHTKETPSAVGWSMHNAKVVWRKYTRPVSKTL